MSRVPCHMSGVMCNFFCKLVKPVCEWSVNVFSWVWRDKGDWEILVLGDLMAWAIGGLRNQ